MWLDPRTPGRAPRAHRPASSPPTSKATSPSLLKLGVRSLALYDDFVARADRRLPAPTSNTPAAARCRWPPPTPRRRAWRALARELAQARVSHRLFDRTRCASSSRTCRRSVHERAAHPVARLRGGRLARGARSWRRPAGSGSCSRPPTVTQVGSAAGGACVHTSNGRIEGDAAVMAAGSWSPLIPVRAGLEAAPPRAAAPVRPVRGQLVRLEVEGPVARHVLWGPAATSCRARRVGAGGRHRRGRRLRRASDGRRRARRCSTRRRAGSRRSRTRSFARRARRPASGHRRRAADRRPLVHNARACSTPPATTATACCWRRSRRRSSPTWCSTDASGPGLELMRPARVGL